MKSFTFARMALLSGWSNKYSKGTIDEYEAKGYISREDIRKGE